MTSSALRGMGTCFSFCCWESRKRARQGSQTKYFDASSLIEFETLIDEPPASGTRSISSWLAMKKGKFGAAFSVVAERRSLLRVVMGERKKEIPKQKGFGNGLGSPKRGATEKLAFSERTKRSKWKGKERASITRCRPRNRKSRVRRQLLTGRTSKGRAGFGPVKMGLPTCSVRKGRTKNVSASRCLQPNCVFTRVTDTAVTPTLTRLPRRERLTSSPHSSLELEWENEVGLTPPQRCESATEEDFVYVPGVDTSSNHSTPLSNENDLEWDGDFSSVQMSGFHADTEQLISEIEQMTAEALREPTSAVR